MPIGLCTLVSKNIRTVILNNKLIFNKRTSIANYLLINNNAQFKAFCAQIH